jgi:hypothetical protein
MGVQVADRCNARRRLPSLNFKVDGPPIGFKGETFWYAEPSVGIISQRGNSITDLTLGETALSDAVTAPLLFHPEASP